MKASKVMWVLMALLLAMTMTVIGCGGDDDTDDTDDTPLPWEAATVTGLSDWEITAGYNGMAQANLSTAGAKQGDNGAIKVVYGGTAQYGTTELYADLTANFDYGQYDGITFKIFADTTLQVMSVIRNVSSAATSTAFVVVEEQIVFEGAGWKTIKWSFDSARQPGWGTEVSVDSINEWLTANKGEQKKLGLNPMLNGGSNNTPYTIYFDDIGFYKGSTNTILWSFNVAP
jgi:hypothetical protein